MQHTEIIKREDGSTIKIVSRIWIDFLDGAQYEVSVYKCPKGKRKFVDVHDGTDYTYRSLGMKERRQHILDTYYKFVTPAEIHAAKIKCWEKLKPTP